MNGQEFNLKLADALKKMEQFKAPEWIQFVKSGPSKERPIEDPDFWYKRAASILKNVYKKKMVGTNRLRTKYGDKKNRGFRPEKFQKSSGKIIRTILQQADAAGLTEVIKSTKVMKQKKSGRQLTKKGKEFLENLK